jgi:hypothetical protein
MKRFILENELKAEVFLDCVNTLRNLQNRQIQCYVEHSFPSDTIYNGRSILELDGSLTGGSWLDVAKLKWKKDSIIDYEEGSKSFWLVIPSATIWLVENMAINIAEDSLTAVRWFNNGEDFLSINFVPDHRD